MPDDEAEPTQTTPKGSEIPMPQREDVMAALRKVAKAPERDEDKDSE